MVFSEVFGAYTRAVGEIINVAVQQNGISKTDFARIVNDIAFRESVDSIRETIRDGNFPVVRFDAGRAKPYYSILKRQYKRPTTMLEKRWLKAISLDPRIKLFCDDDIPGLDDVVPLFRPEDIVYYDQQLNGDNYSDLKYRENFKKLLIALQENKVIRLSYLTRDIVKEYECVPVKLEYSLTNDKFRLLAAVNNKDYPYTYFPLAKVDSIFVLQDSFEELQDFVHEDKKALVLDIDDVNGTMQRVFLAFSHLKRESEKIGENKYRMQVEYDSFDEAEIIIRVLSFGKFVKVIEPEGFKEKITMRIAKQKELLSCH